MAAGDLIRLAWEAAHDGRARLRDTLLTLAVAESTDEDPWAERCRGRLIADRPDHFFAQFPTLDRALQDPRVVEARARLRAKYPDAKVQSLLLKARTIRGPYLGRVESLEAMVEDLVGPPAEAENVRRDAAQPSRGPTHLHRAARPLAFALAYPSIATGLEESHARPRPMASRDRAEDGRRAADRGLRDLLRDGPADARLPAGGRPGPGRLTRRQAGALGPASGAAG